MPWNLKFLYFFQSGSETTVTIIFEANPQPQLIWHHIADGGKDENIDENGGGRPDYFDDDTEETDVPPFGSFNLSPGSEDGNYKALEIGFEGKYQVISFIFPWKAKMCFDFFLQFCNYFSHIFIQVSCNNA